MVDLGNFHVVSFLFNSYSASWLSKVWPGVQRLEIGCSLVQGLVHSGAVVFGMRIGSSTRTCVIRAS